MGVFRLNPAGIDQDDLELYLIDHGLEEMGESTGEKGEPQLVIRGAFADFGKLQEAPRGTRGIAPLSAEHEYICTVPTELPEEQATEVLTLIDKLEQDEDVQKVFHTLRYFSPDTTDCDLASRCWLTTPRCPPAQRRCDTSLPLPSICLAGATS